MRKLVVFILVGITAFQFFSCKDDEVPPVVISFESQNSIVSEGVGTATIKLNLDKAAPGEITLNFTIGGSAQATEDYVSSGSIIIPNGASEAELPITIIDDAVFEFDPKITSVFGEVMEITLSGVTGNGKLSEEPSKLKYSLIIRENDPVARSLNIELSWDSGDGTPGDVDMDLILFYLDPDKGPSTLTASSSVGVEFEGIGIGTPAPDGTYGLAFRYFEGTSDHVTFTCTFTSENGTLPGGVSTKSYTGVYSQMNVNGDVSQNASVQVVQTFEKKGLNYTSISEITIPDSGSRSKLIQGKAPAKR